MTDKLAMINYSIGSPPLQGGPGPLELARRIAEWQDRRLALRTEWEGRAVLTRRARVEAYCLKHAITKRQFNQLTEYKDMSNFYRWQRNDPKSTKAANRNFERILSKDPL